MALSDEFLDSFTAAHSDSCVIVKGRPGARYLMSIARAMTILVIDGEPEAADFTAVFAEARRTKPFVDRVAILIDLNGFTGTVDWSAVKALHDAVDWRDVSRLKIAYWVRDMQYAPLAKIAGAIFPEAEHVVFEDKRLALAWLSSD
jgi:hypothetical protein